MYMKSNNKHIGDPGARAVLDGVRVHPASTDDSLYATQVERLAKDSSTSIATAE
jgi:hypothetical protein